jgi:glycolate oxidase subunit GlcD
MTSSDSVARALRRLLGDGVVLGPDSPHTLSDDSGLAGTADAIALPRTSDDVARAVAWCYEHDVPIVARGGGTGFTGGAVPLSGGVVVGLERMGATRALDPSLWRMQVEAGVRTATVQRLARENGLFFPPDPGAAEQSQLGGNVATNAGGPHAFKYGVTRAWVTGLEAIVAPGERIAVGGPVRKDVAGYDLVGLLSGSEGTLGVITAAWLRLLPAREAALPLTAFYRGSAEGSEAIEAVLGNGLEPATLEYLDAGALAAAGRAFPRAIPAGARFAVLAEADGSRVEAERVLVELSEVLGERALAVEQFRSPREAESLWRWRDGVSIAVRAQRGEKVSEDIVVPLDRLGEAIEETLAIGARHGLEACSWGHAGDGNLHSTFLVDPLSEDELGRAQRAAEDLFELAARLGGSVSGEHGLGWTKRGQLARQWPPAALELHERLKRTFDPKGLFNPGKKTAHQELRVSTAGSAVMRDSFGA